MTSNSVVPIATQFVNPSITSTARRPQVSNTSDLPALPLCQYNAQSTTQDAHDARYVLNMSDVTGRSFPDLMRDSVLEPLAMKSGAGIAVLTNSDNGGRLAHELMLTIAREYGWSGFPQTEKTVVHLSEADLARVLGHYKMDTGGAGELDLVAKGERILLQSSVMPDRELMAESPDKFFLRDDGTLIEIVTHEGPTALTIGGAMHAVKVQ